MLSKKKNKSNNNFSFSIPRSVQDVIPVVKIFDDGIFLVGKDTYTKSFKFSDINYVSASKADKEAILLKYCELLNSLAISANFKITLHNHTHNKAEFQKNVLLSYQNDDLDNFRKQYNEMLSYKTLYQNNITQDRYIIVTINKKTIDEARTYFQRIEVELTSSFSQLGSSLEPISLNKRLELLYNFYNPNIEDFQFNLINERKLGHSFKDKICPESFEIKDDYFKTGTTFGRVLFLKNYATYMKDSLIKELTELNKNLMLSIDIMPVDTAQAIKEVEKRCMNVETNIATWQRHQNYRNNFSAVIPYELEQQRIESKEFLNDLTTRDQKMFITTLTLVHLAETMEQLDNDTDTLINIANKYSCQLSILRYQQLDALQTVLPLGVRNISALRTLTTESLASLNFFKTQEISHKGGIFYGQNYISKNNIIIDRRKLANGNAFILGSSGFGKSFAAKHEILSIALSDSNADIIIIDPEAEYSKLIGSLGGQVIKISSTSDNHINALDINMNYSDSSNPITLKSEFILSLCEILLGTLNPIQKSIVDRCTSSVYRNYLQSNYKTTPPTLVDFHQELLNQPEDEAKDIALALEIFTNGTLNTFAYQTNVDLNKRIISFDISELSSQLRALGMLVVLDSILNRITKNRANKRNTYIYIDEVYLMFLYEYAANFLFTLYKRARKYGAMITGITQNVEDILQSHVARTMLANSEFLLIFNQSSTDKIELAKLLNISELQMSYVSKSSVGNALMKVGGVLIPFNNLYPKGELYKMMTSKMSEV